MFEDYHNMVNINVFDSFHVIVEINIIVAKMINFVKATKSFLRWKCLGSTWYMQRRSCYFYDLRSE